MYNIRCFADMPVVKEVAVQLATFFQYLTGLRSSSTQKRDNLALGASNVGGLLQPSLSEDGR